MTTSILAHFDGKVFIPDEPVNVAAGTPMLVTYEPLDTATGAAPSGRSVHQVPEDVTSMIARLPLIRGLDPDFVREVIVTPENELCNLDAETFLSNVDRLSNRNKTD